MNWELELLPLKRISKALQSFIPLQKVVFGLLLVLFLCSAINSSLYATKLEKPSLSFIDYLSAEKNRLQQNIASVKQQHLPEDEADFLSKKDFINSMSLLNQARLKSLNAFYNNQAKQQLDYAQKLKELQQLPLTSNNQAIQERVSKYAQLLLENKNGIDLLKDNISASEQFQDLLDDQMKKLNQWNVHFQLEKKLSTIKTTKEQLKQELQGLFQNNKVDPQKTNTIDDEINILINHQRIAVVQNELSVLELQEKILGANILSLQNSDLKTLQQVIDTYTDVLSQYKDITSNLQLLNDSLNAEVKNHSLEDKPALSALQKRIKDALGVANASIQVVNTQLQAYQNQQKKLILTRQSLTEYRMKTWPNTLHKILAIPNLFYKAAKTLVLKVYDSFSWLDKLHKYLLFSVFLMIFALFLILNHTLKLIISYKERSSLSGYLYDGLLILIKRNLPLFCLASMLVSIFYYTNIAYANYELFFNLFIIWLIFRSLIIISHLVLVENISDNSGEDVRLYFRIKWMLLFGGWTAALMTFSHLLPLSPLLQDIFNRLFMLFILTISFVAWKSRGLILNVLSPLLKLKKRYIKHVITLLIILVPLTLFTTALIGLSGLFDLAWTLSRYQAFILMIIVGYIFARGLLFDALEYVSEWMIILLNNGWLWIEVILKPLDKMLRLVLVIISLLCLFKLLGWSADSLVMLKLQKIAKYPLLNITGIHITVESTIEFLFSVAIFYWLAKWTREFCYRWLYTNTSDLSVRKSLSVFTQYALILLGAYISLWVLGFDFGGMSMILGGLAVGMGFGLKDFANDIIGGVMLLIERPVREGDLISIGQYEGEVAHIGIRSMRVVSLDNTEVVMPNSEAFNKPFINWTHRDGIVRTVIPIKVSRADAPELVQQLIFNVINTIPEILASPVPEVFLVNIDAALIEFQIRYYINIHEHTRFAIRSKLLFALTECFKSSGIRPPISPIAIEFQEGYSDLVKHNTSED